MTYTYQDGDQWVQTTVFNSDLTYTPVTQVYRPDGAGGYNLIGLAGTDATSFSMAYAIQVARASLTVGSLTDPNYPFIASPQTGKFNLQPVTIEAIRYLVAKGEFTLAQADALVANSEIGLPPATLLDPLPAKLTGVTETYFANTFIAASTALHNAIANLHDTALMDTVVNGKNEPWYVPAGQSVASWSAAELAVSPPAVTHYVVGTTTTLNHDSKELTVAVKAQTLTNPVTPPKPVDLSWLSNQYCDAAEKAYIAYFGRPADLGGIKYSEDLIAAHGGNVNAMSLSFAPSAESQAFYAGKSTTDMVTTAYNQILGRAPEKIGLDYWVGVIDSGKLSQTDMCLAILNGAQAADLTTVNNKVLAAKYFTQYVPEASYNGNHAAANGRAYLSSISSDIAGLTKALTVSQDATFASHLNAGDVSGDLTLVGLQVGSFYHG